MWLELFATNEPKRVQSPSPPPPPLGMSNRSLTRDDKMADELHAKLLKTPLDSMRPTMPRTAETLRKTLRALAETAGNGR